MNKTAIVIPTYNCATQLLRVLEKIAHFPNENIEKILIVDNQSRASEIDIVRSFLEKYSLRDKVKCFQNKVNLGLGATFKRSWIYLEENGYQRMIFLHGDDQAEISDYFGHLKVIDNPKFQISFGSRFVDTSLVRNYSLRRMWVNIALNKVLGMMTRTHITEMGSGLNVYNLKSISKESILSFSNHIAFDLELLIFCIKHKVPFQFFPIHWKSADEQSTINEFSVGIKLLKIIFQQAIFNYSPEPKPPLPISDGWVLLNE